MRIPRRVRPGCWRAIYRFLHDVVRVLRHLATSFDRDCLYDASELIFLNASHSSHVAFAFAHCESSVPMVYTYPRRTAPCLTFFSTRVSGNLHKRFKRLCVLHIFPELYVVWYLWCTQWLPRCGRHQTRALRYVRSQHRMFLNICSACFLIMLLFHAPWWVSFSCCIDWMRSIAALRKNSRHTHRHLDTSISEVKILKIVSNVVQYFSIGGPRSEVRTNRHPRFTHNRPALALWQWAYEL